MIVNQFRSWVVTAAPSDRAEAASALARAYLYSELDATQQANVITVLTALLDDASPLVRRAMAEAFAGAADAPHHIVLALADDQASIASIILARSPVLTDAELIDCAATADPLGQCAIASRLDISRPVCAALAEIAAPEALIALAQNPCATLPVFSVRRMVQRHGGEANLREALLLRPDLPSCVRIDLVAETAKALAAFVASRNWMSEERLARVSREARDRAAIVIADADADRNGAVALIAHLREAGHLTVGFIFRALLCGKTELFRAALSELSGMPLARVDGLVDQCLSTGFSALYRRAALPIELLPAFRIALEAIREVEWTGSCGPNLSRAIIERVLSGCAAINEGEYDKLIVLLRRFEVEAARDEARDVSTAIAPTSPLRLRHKSDPLMLVDVDAVEQLPAARSAQAWDRSEPSFAALEGQLRAA